MTSAYRLLLAFHVVLGTVALGSFWGAALSHKGGRVRRRCGRVFAASMAATTLTAMVLCSLLLYDPLGARPPEGPMSSTKRPRSRSTP